MSEVASVRFASDRGALIVFEGIDKCGKTTQSIKLVENLKKSGIPAVHMRFPDRTTVTGKTIDQYLKSATELDDKAIHLLFSANRWETYKVILDTLSEGTTVVLDRYAYSGVVFSTMKGLDIEWCKTPDKGLPQPDAVFYLHISIADATKRGGFGQERYEKEEIQRQAKALFEDEMMDDSWFILEANKPVEDLQTQIQSIATDIIKNSKRKKLSWLWD